jgi:hypothetical protein
MCFGGGGSAPKSADAYYNEMKASRPAFKLPSLAMGEKTKVERKGAEMKDVKETRKGVQKRSLLNPLGIDQNAK